MRNWVNRARCQEEPGPGQSILMSCRYQLYRLLPKKRGGTNRPTDKRMGRVRPRRSTPWYRCDYFRIGWRVLKFRRLDLVNIYIQMLVTFMCTVFTEDKCRICFVWPHRCPPDTIHMDTKLDTIVDISPFIVFCEILYQYICNSCVEDNRKPILMTQDCPYNIRCRTSWEVC